VKKYKERRKQMERSYENEVAVNKDELEIDLEKLSSQYLYWSRFDVEAKEEKEKAEQRLEVIKAQVDSDVRTNPAKFGMDKATETAIRNVVVLSAVVQAAESEVIKATKNARLLTSAISSFDKKASALGHLVDLWKNGYYSSKGVSKEMREGIEHKKQDRINETLSATIKKRNK
jgi:hypothetical protein